VEERAVGHVVELVAGLGRAAIQISRRTAALAAAAFILSTAIGVTALVRTATAGGTFTDTPPWIEAHADWLAANSIATGYPDDSFRPNDSITRGQSAFWLGNYNDAIEIVEESTDPGSSDLFLAKADCPGGKRPVAGGGYVDGVSDVFVTASFPAGPPTPERYVVFWESEGDVAVDPTEIVVWALCAPGTINTP
jgi:hypothetical protein